MAAEQVLSTPELLATVLQCLEEQRGLGYFSGNRIDRLTLTGAARVNSLWFEAATNVLWSYSPHLGPSLGDLEKIERSRRQIYASKLLSVTIREDPGRVPDTDLLSFSRLKELAVNRAGYHGGPSVATIKQWLCSSLELVDFMDWADGFNKDLLDTMTSQCPRLRSISLERIRTKDNGLSPQDFDIFFRNNRSLESISLDFELLLMTSDLFSTFCQMKNLGNLSIISRLSLKQVPETFLKESSTFFENLREVDLMLQRKAVEPATMALRNAVKVNLNIESDPDEKTTMFSHLKHMKNLKNLALDFEGENTFLHGEDLTQLSTLQNLETLQISPRRSDYEKTNLESFAEAGFQTICEGLPQLESLDWQLEMDLSVDTLTSLSTHCPKLTDINFSGAWDLRALSDVSGCLFPELQSLIVDKPAVKGHKGIVPFKRIAENIHRHAPKLQYLEFVKHSTSKVVGAWQKLIENKI